MKHRVIVTAGFSLVAVVGILLLQQPVESEIFSVATESEFEHVEDETVESRFLQRLKQRYPDINQWQRPNGPTRVGIQVGHWKNSELPDELERLRGSSTGTSGGGKTEVEVNLAIAQATAEMLEAEGIEVDILPATIPPRYWADAFVAIHADGNSNSNTSGFKIAAPRRDITEQGKELVALIEQEYHVTTQLGIDKNITRNMSGYYAFNWWRYEHAIHPMTPAVIVETGFLTSPHDQRIIIHQQEKAAQGIVNGIRAFLNK